jgi:hypothetical protein
VFTGALRTAHSAAKRPALMLAIAAFVRLAHDSPQFGTIDAALFNMHGVGSNILNVLLIALSCAS